MTRDHDNPFWHLIELETRFHEAAPINALCSKLLLRSFLWFCLFTAIYYLFFVN
jgi:hypothetical protein